MGIEHPMSRTKARRNVGYCRRHPNTKLPLSLMILRKQVGCWRCVKKRRILSRHKRASLWDSSFIACTRHPQRRSQRNAFIQSWKKACSSCCARNTAGRLYPSALRVRRQQKISGQSAAISARSYRKRLDKYGEEFLEHRRFREKSRCLRQRIQEIRL